MINSINSTSSVYNNFQNKKVISNDSKTEKNTNNSNNNKIIYGLLGLAALGVATVVLYKGLKSGKAPGGIEEINIGRKTSQSVEDKAKELLNTRKDVQKLEVITQAKLPDGTFHDPYTINVIYKSDSVQADVENFLKMRSQQPKKANAHEKDGVEVPINSDFNRFKILPHNYNNDTDILINTRDYSRDFESYKVENGKMQLLKRDLPYLTEGKEKFSSYHLDFQPTGKCLQTGKFEDGRQYVSFTYHTGEKVDSRRGYETIVLLSKNGEFTQVQKDIIKIFEANKDKPFEYDISPMLMARLTTPNQYDFNKLASQVHKNSLLSVISSWAKNTPPVDVEKLIQERGSTFRIGIDL